MGRTAWVETFLHQHKMFLPAAQRENVFNYNLAAFYYQTQAYDQAVELLQSVTFTDPYLDINGRIILLKIYYYQENYFSFYYFLDAFKIGLKRNRDVATPYRTAIHTFLGLFRRLAQLRERWEHQTKTKRRTNYDKLHDRIQNAPNCFDQRWLKGEIEKRKP
ncbi:MAG: hypothetical protein AAGJ82_15065 [Bacteroidota bacterium]